MDDLLAAQLRQEAIQNKNNKKIIDWVKVFDTIKKENIKNAEVGLKDDFEETKGLLMINREIQYPLIDNSIHGTFLYSVWATPILLDLDTLKEYPCYYEVPHDSTEKSTTDYLSIDEVKKILKFSIKKYGDSMNAEYIVNHYYKGVYLLDKLGIKKTEKLIKKASQWASETCFDPFNYDCLPRIEEIRNVELIQAWDEDLGDDLNVLIDRCRAIIKLDKVKDYHNYVDYSLTYGRYNLSTIDRVVEDPSFLEEDCVDGFI